MLTPRRDDRRYQSQTLIQGPGIDILLGSQWTEKELDAINVESMTILLMNAQNQS